MASHGFHPDALAEYSDGAMYYLHEASTQIAEDFIATVESAIATLISDPMRWRIVEEPEVRRYFLSRFPYVIYYRWERERVAIYAVMHCSREPGYWHHRLPAA